MTGKRLRKITDLEITEVSLVDSGANERAKVLLWKREHGARKLWDEFVRQFLSVHNKKLAELKANPPEKFSLQQLKDLQQRKPWSKDQAALEARKTSEGSSLGQAVVQEAQPPLGKGKIMYKSVGEIAKAMESGEIESQEDALKVFDEFVEGEVKKSDYSMDVKQARLMKMTGPGWDSYYNAFMNLPATIQEKESFEKRQNDTDAAYGEIEKRAKQLLDAGKVSSIEKGIVTVCERFPELEAAYREATGIVTKGR